MQVDPNGENPYVIAAVASLLITWVANANNVGEDVKNNGGSWSTGFAYGLAHPTVSFSVSFYQGSDGSWKAGERPATTGSISDYYSYDLSIDVMAVVYNYNDDSSEESIGDIYDLDFSNLYIEGPQLASNGGGIGSKNCYALRRIINLGT
jgi:hypothetical protein